MADIDLTVQKPTRASITPTYTALNAVDVYKFVNDGNTMLHFKNTGASPSTVSVVTPGTVDGNAIADKTFSVPATSGDKMAGTWPGSVYNDPADNNKARFTQDQATGVSVAVISLS